MTTPVSSVPTAFSLSQTLVGNTVSSSHLARIADDISFLLGQNVNVVADGEFRERNVVRQSLTTLATKTYPFAYYRSSSAQVLRIEAQLYDESSAKKSTISVTMPSGAAWLSNGGMDGTTAYTHPLSGLAEHPSFVGYINVSGCTSGSLLTGAVVVTQSTGTGRGLQRLAVTECPMATLDSPTQDCIDASTTVAGNRIYDGNAATAGGFARFQMMLDSARKNSRKHFQLLGIEATDTTAPAVNSLWYTDGDGGAAYQQINLIDTGLGAATNSDGFRIQVSDLYEDGGQEPWTLTTRYCTETATGGILRITYQGVAGAGATTQDLTLPGTSGAWSWVSVACSMPTDGTDNVTTLAFTCKNNQAAGDLIKFACISVLEAAT